MANKLEEKKQEVMSWCASLACSQGFYGRLLEMFKEDDEALTQVATDLIDTSDIVDFVMYIES